MPAETPSNASLPAPYVVPSEILTVIGRYYAHRRQSRIDNAINAASPLGWDKDADLASLNEVCERLRTPYEASCGTFQFTAPDGSMHRIDEDSYPHSKPVNASIMGQVLAARLPQPTEISVRMQQKETEILNYLRSLIRPDSGISLQTLNQFPDVKAVFEEISQTAYKIVSFIERD